MSSLFFPTLRGQTLDVVRSPKWNTTVQKALTGKRTTISYQFYPRIHFELSFDILRDDLATSDLKALIGLYNQLSGAYDTFLFVDPDFNTISSGNQSPFGVGDGSTTVFQLTALYANAGGTGWYEMTQSLNGAPSIYINGGLQSSGYTVGSTGVVTFTTAPAANANLTWAGGFYYRCSFDEDDLDLNKFMNQWWEAKKIAFTQVLL